MPLVLKKLFFLSLDICWLKKKIPFGFSATVTKLIEMPHRSTLIYLKLLCNISCPTMRIIFSNSFTRQPEDIYYWFLSFVGELCTRPVDCNKRNSKVLWDLTLVKPIFRMTYNIPSLKIRQYFCFWCLQ